MRLRFEVGQYAGSLVAVGVMMCNPLHADDTVALGWLSGCWVQKTGDTVVEEQWLAPSGGVMLGAGRTVRDGVLRNYEFMRIQAIDGVPTFFAMPSGQSPAAFPSKSQTAGEIVFENAAHDFPQRLVYRRTPDGLHADISGPSDGKTLTLNFDYSRCVP